MKKRSDDGLASWLNITGRGRIPDEIVLDFAHWAEYRPGYCELSDLDDGKLATYTYVDMVALDGRRQFLCRRFDSHRELSEDKRQECGPRCH
jgi:hypothetical protein